MTIGDLEPLRVRRSSALPIVEWPQRQRVDVSNTGLGVDNGR